MIKPKYEDIVKKLVEGNMVVSEISDTEVRKVLRYLILKLRHNF